MSERPYNPQTGAIPKQPQLRRRAAVPRRSSPPAQSSQQPPPPKVYENPAFSIPLRRIETDPLLAEKEKRKTIRRNVPEKEDLAEIKRVVASVRKQPDVTAAEFVGLVAPYTGDNGQALQEVLTDDMNSFRKLARRIYDTMTKDVGDVLTNQHLQVKEFDQERSAMYAEKMMRAINEIYHHAPQFDFEAYYAGKESYLLSLFPIPRAIAANSEEAEVHRRQQAFHRFNWLKTEGERLAAENVRLQARLNELKREQREELRLAEAREAAAEARRNQLCVEEAAVHQHLEALTGSVEKTILDTEEALREVTDSANLTTPLFKGTKEASTRAPRRRKRRPEWVSDVAVDIEKSGIIETVVSEGMHSHIANETLATAVQAVQTRTPFHFSPIQTPPIPKPVPPSDVVTTRLTTEQKTVTTRPPGSYAGRARRGMEFAPKDTWASLNSI